MMSTNYDVLANKYKFSRDAVQALAQAIARGHGKQAQFNHPEFAGMGQWMPGLVMISDMMNNDLKARIIGLAEELSGQFVHKSPPTMSPMQFDRWWGDDFGEPAMAGSQNERHYAYFPAEQRLMVKRGNTIIAYDTANHHLTGVQQAQANSTSSLVFTTRTGTVREEDLRKIPS